MEPIQQLKKWQQQIADFPDVRQADIDVTKRLLRHGMQALEEIERLRIGHSRYETARRMDPRRWRDAWMLNLSTGKPFDEIIDELAPFMTANAVLSGHGPQT